jgi:acetoin utilization protein AcuB
MFVKDRMTVNPVSVTEHTPITEAGELLRQNNFARLPVVRDGKVVGIITRDDLLKVSPSAATSLSVWELNYVLSKLAVKDAMTKNPITISPEATLEEAALLMREKGVGALPVVEKELLVGIITESDIFDAFIELMGLKATGIRLAIDLQDRIGEIADLTEIIREHGFNIVSLALFHRKNNQNQGELVVRLSSGVADKLVAALKAKQYRVVHIAKWA